MASKSLLDCTRLISKFYRKNISNSHIKRFEKTKLIEEPIKEDYSCETTNFIEENNNLDIEIERSIGEVPSIEIFVESPIEGEEEVVSNEEEN